MDNVRTTVLPSDPKRPRLDRITTGDEGGHSPSDAPPSWGTEQTDSSRVNPDRAAQRHSDDPPWEEYNRGEKCEAVDFPAAVADASASSESDSGTASSHADGSAIAARSSSGGVSSAPGAGGGAEEEESAYPSRREEERPSASAEPAALERSDAGAVAVPRRCTPLTWPGLSPEGRRWPAGAGPPPADEGEGARPEGGGGDTGEALQILLPGEVKAGEVRGRCVYGDAERNGRSRPSLGGGGVGDEEGDGHSVRERLPLKGGGGGDEVGDGHSVRERLPLKGGGGGDEEGDGHSVRERLPLIGGGGDEEASGRAAPADDVFMTSSPSDQEAILYGLVSGVGKRNVESSCKKEENETMYNAEAWRETTQAEQGSAPPSPAAAGCIGSPVITHDALLDRKVPGAVATKAGPRPVIDDPRGGEGTRGAGQRLATGAPHKIADQASGEALMPAQITQGRLEGGNDTGPFRVIDPAICSQAGGQDRGKSSTWRSAAGVGLSPSGVRGLAPIPESVNARRSVPDTKEIPSSSSDDQACSSEELTGATHDTCPSATGEMCFSFFTNGPPNETKRETHISEGGHALAPPRASCPANSLCESFEHIPPGGEIEEQSLTPAGALGEHQDLIEWSGQDPLNAQVETKITERILVKTICFEGEQLTPVIDSPDKIRQHRLTAATNQQQNATSVVPASGLVSDWFNATMGESCYQSLVLPSLHPEDEPGTEACVLSSAPSGYRPAINVMDMMEHHPSPQRTAAVVPGSQRCTTPSLTYRHDALIRNTQERFQPSPPPSPSALLLPDRPPAAADTFEKIQLSSSDDDEECGGDEGPGHSPVLTGSAELWKPSRRLLPRSLPGAQSPGQRGREPPRAGEEPGADAVLKPQPQREETGRRCFDSFNRPWEIPGRASTVPPASKPPVTQPVPTPCRVSQAAFTNWFPAAGDDGDDDGDGKVSLVVETFQGFAMKQQFDEVVQELQQFFEIGMSDPLDLSSSDWGSVLTGAPGSGGDQTSPLTESLGGTSSDIEAAISLRIKDNDEDGRGVCGLKADGCSPEPVAPPQGTGTSEPDQQVPPADCSPPCLDGEDSMYSVGKHREENEKKEDHIIHRAVTAVSESREKKEPVWSQSFQSQRSEMQYSQRQTDPHRRLEPLKTCARPIRVGLSKRAKTSHLHRNHPYK